jgi:hypothetical protein
MWAEPAERAGRYLRSLRALETHILHFPPHILQCDEGAQNLSSSRGPRRFLYFPFNPFACMLPPPGGKQHPAMVAAVH